MNDPRMDRTPPDDPAPRKSWLATFLSPIVAIPLLIGSVMLIAPFAFRAYRVSGMTDIGDPFDTAKWGTVTVPAGDNAYDDYNPASKMIVALPGGEVNNLDRAIEHGWEHASPGIRSWIDSNRPALARWKLGTTKADALYVQPKDMQIDTLLPVIQEMREFARMARIEASRLESEGKWDEAWQWHRAMYRSSRHSGRHGCLIERLVGMAIHGMSTVGIERWAAHPEITAKQLSQALDDIQKDAALSAPLSSSFKTEYLYATNTLDRDDLLAMLDDFGGGGMNKHIGRAGLFVLNEPLASRLMMQQLFANILEEADKPLSKRQPLVAGRYGLFELSPAAKAAPGRMTPAQIEEQMKNAPLAALLAPALTSVDKAFFKEQSRQSVLVTVLALQIFKRQFGDFPERLDALVEKGILKSVPTDPFSRTDEPLIYRKEEGKIVVYGRGEDAADDRGDFEKEQGKDIGAAIPPVRKPLPDPKESEEKTSDADTP